MHWGFSLGTCAKVSLGRFRAAGLRHREEGRRPVAHQSGCTVALPPGLKWWRACPSCFTHARCHLDWGCCHSGEKRCPISLAFPWYLGRWSVSSSLMATVGHIPGHLVAGSKGLQPVCVCVYMYVCTYACVYHLLFKDYIFSPNCPSIITESNEPAHYRVCKLYFFATLYSTEFNFF